MLGRYCASTDESEISEGLEIVEKQLKDRCFRTGQEEVFKNEALRKGSVRVIDVIRARLDAKNACYIAELPSLALRDVRISDQMVAENERMLIDGFYAEITLSYDSVIAQEKNGRPFGIEALRPIQMSRSDVLDTLYAGRRSFETTDEWTNFLLRSIGLEPSAFDEGSRTIRYMAAEASFAEFVRSLQVLRPYLAAGSDGEFDIWLASAREGTPDWTQFGTLFTSPPRHPQAQG